MTIEQTMKAETANAARKFKAAAKRIKPQVAKVACGNEDACKVFAKIERLYDRVNDPYIQDCKATVAKCLATIEALIVECRSAAELGSESRQWRFAAKSYALRPSGRGLHWA